MLDTIAWTPPATLVSPYVTRNEQSCCRVFALQVTFYPMGSATLTLPIHVILPSQQASDSSACLHVVWLFLTPPAAESATCQVRQAMIQIMSRGKSCSTPPVQESCKRGEELVIRRHQKHLLWPRTPRLRWMHTQRREPNRAGYLGSNFVGEQHVLPWSE